MKMNKLLIGVAVIATLTACEKEETYMRNYTYPMNLSDPTGSQGSGNILIYEGESDDNIMERVRNFDYLKGKEIIFLSTEVYGNGDYSIKNPDPEYMLFPHVISTSPGSHWGWEKLQEYRDLGEEEFCNKYFNGERTLGMKLD